MHHSNWSEMLPGRLHTCSRGLSDLRAMMVLPSSDACGRGCDSASRQNSCSVHNTGLT